MALRELFAKFGVDFDAGPLNRGNESVSNVASNLRKLGAVIAGAAVVRGISRFIGDVRVMGDDLDKTSIQLGITTRQLQEWQFAAGLAGVDASAFAQSLGLLQRNADQAAGGTGEQAKAFARLGISVRDSAGQLKDGSALLEETGLAIGALDNPSERVALSMQLMGRSGRRMLPLFTQGAEGLARARAELEELGGGLSQDVIDQTVQLTDEEHRLATAMTALRGRIALVLLPTIVKFVSGMKRVIEGFLKVTQGTHVVELAMAAIGVAMTALSAKAIVLGIKMLIPWLPLIATILLVAVVVGLVILVVDDLITLFDGGQSVIGDFIDALFGVGSAQSAINNLKLAWEGIALAIHNAGVALGLIEDMPAPAVRTAEQLASDQFRAGALEGRVTRTRAQRDAGITQEELRQQANRIRIGAGESTVIGSNGGLRAATRAERRAVGEAFRPQARARAGVVRVPAGAPAGVSNAVRQGDITLNFEGVRDSTIQRTVRETVRRVQDSQLRDTVGALTQLAEPAGG